MLGLTAWDATPESIDLVHVVVSFVPAVDRAAGPRVRHVPVRTVYEADPLAHIRTVLDLGREDARLVDDGRTRPEQVRVTGVAQVRIRLREQTSVRIPRLRIAVGPSSGLASVRRELLDA